MSFNLKATGRFSVICVDTHDSTYERFLNLTKTISYDDARASSCKERATSYRPDAPNLTYGEVEYSSLEIVINKIKKYRDLGNNLAFVDLGSGCGRPIIAAAVLHPFRKCIGIELLSGLHEMALTAKSAFDAENNGSDTELEFINGSILEHDWPQQADIILANSTCFSIPFFAQIEQMSHACRPGTFFVSLTHECGMGDKQLHWELLETLRLKMSWGEADVCISRRR